MSLLRTPFQHIHASIACWSLTTGSKIQTQNCSSRAGAGDAGERTRSAGRPADQRVGCSTECFQYRACPTQHAVIIGGQQTNKSVVESPRVLTRSRVHL
jgi:hypothetical protein